MEAFELDLIKVRKLLNYSFSSIDIENHTLEFARSRADQRSSLQSEFGLPIRDSIGWKEILRDIPNDGAMEKDQPDTAKSIDAIECFKDVIRECLSNNTTESHFELLYKFQHKFEIFKRLFRTYNSQLRAINEEYSDACVYSMFSISLSAVYMINADLNCLNTALKVNDLLLGANWNMDAEVADLIHTSLHLEQLAIEKLKNG